MSPPPNSNSNSQKQHKLGKPSPSFRLRNPSLNTLRLRRIFDLFDNDSDGFISPSELSLALDRLGLSSDPSDVSALLSPFLLPPRPTHGLDFDAFQALHRSLGDALDQEDEHFFNRASDADQNTNNNNDESVTEEEFEMAEAFKVFDENGDGYISAKELQTVLGKLGLKEGESMERVNAMIGSVDCNKDGRVDFDEFKIMMRTVSVQGC